VLAALAKEVDQAEGKASTAKDLLLRLGKRVDWAKAVKLAAKTGLALQIPSIENLVDLVRPAEGMGTARNSRIASSVSMTVSGRHRSRSSTSTATALM
jgi:hypothetical protein